MSVQRERSVSIRSRQLLVKVNQASKRLPGDFFLPKTQTSSPPKKDQEQSPQAALQHWYQKEDSEATNSGKRQAARIKQVSRLCLFKTGEEVTLAKPNERQNYYQHLLESMHRKQNIALRAIRQVKEQPRPPKLLQRPIRFKQPNQQSQERVIKSEGKRHRRLMFTPEKQRARIVREARLSLKQLPHRYSEVKSGEMNVGFDGLLTFNRFN